MYDTLVIGGACAPKSYSTVSRITFEGNGHLFFDKQPELTIRNGTKHTLARNLRQGEDVPWYDPMMLQLDA